MIVFIFLNSTLVKYKLWILDEVEFVENRLGAGALGHRLLHQF